YVIESVFVILKNIYILTSTAITLTGHFNNVSRTAGNWILIFSYIVSNIRNCVLNVLMIQEVHSLIYRWKRITNLNCFWINLCLYIFFFDFFFNTYTFAWNYVYYE
ncbi:hypothetical protein L9F63_014024, partial [Diploptera punctata]